MDVLSCPTADRDKQILCYKVLILMLMLMNIDSFQRGRSQKVYVWDGRGHYNPSCSPPGPGGVQVLERWEIAADRLLGRMNDGYRTWSMHRMQEVTSCSLFRVQTWLGVWSAAWNTPGLVVLWPPHITGLCFWLFLQHYFTLLTLYCLFVCLFYLLFVLYLPCYLVTQVSAYFCHSLRARLWQSLMT